MENFKYLVAINQRAVVELGLKVDFVDMAIFDFIKDFSHSNACMKVNTEIGLYYWVSHKTILQKMPMLGIKSAQGLVKRINNLVNAGLLKKHPCCDQLGKTLYAFGDTYDLYIGFETPTTKITPPQQKFRESPNKSLGSPPTKVDGISNINDYTTNDNTNNDLYSSEINTPQNNKSVPKKEKKGFDLSFVNIAFEDVFNERLEYKHARHEMYKTQKSLELCYSKLLKFSNNDPHTAQEIIESAIGNNYSGFFELKTNNNNGQRKQQQPESLAKQLARKYREEGLL